MTLALGSAATCSQFAEWKNNEKGQRKHSTDGEMEGRKRKGQGRGLNRVKVGNEKLKVQGEKEKWNMYYQEYEYATRILSVYNIVLLK